MLSNIAIRLNGLGKCYQIYDAPHDRLLQMLLRGRRQYYREFWAVRDITFDVFKGEVVGIVGRNGAGKSTLLQMICGTLNPTEGAITVNGRVAALLELGSGFNTEFTGRENVYMSAAIVGLSRAEINARYDEIVSFSGIGDFIDQPVKTYSSGMCVRLAFSVATSIEADILIVDEALSVGDGEFSRKSFDRIMRLREKGVTILFCSHSTYHIEAISNRACWLDHGSVRMMDISSNVVSAYQAALDADTSSSVAVDFSGERRSGGCLREIVGTVDGVSGALLNAISLESTVSVSVEFQIDTDLPVPCVALVISNEAGMTVSSVSSINDNISLEIDEYGQGRVMIVFPRLTLLKGTYYVTAYLLCDQALYVYDILKQCLTLQITQNGFAQGVVELTHEWQV